MHSRYIVARHMATRAVRRRLRADHRRAGSGRFASAWAVASQTSRIIRARISNQGLVRVMTRNAGQTIVALNSPATAFFQAVGLEANIDRAIGSFGHDNVHSGPVASPTEVNQVDRAQMSWIQNCLGRFVDLASLYRIDMIHARPMTCFATDSRYCAGNVELGIRGRIRSVTAKTQLCRGFRKTFPQCILEVARLYLRMPGS